jgi:hypothetical protein
MKNGDFIVYRDVKADGVPTIGKLMTNARTAMLIEPVHSY